MTSVIWSISDIARSVGVSRQAVSQRYYGQQLPDPDFVTVGGTPYWSDRQAAEIIGNWPERPARGK